MNVEKIEHAIKSADRKMAIEMEGYFNSCGNYFFEQRLNRWKKVMKNLEDLLKKEKSKKPNMRYSVTLGKLFTPMGM